MAVAYAIVMFGSYMDEEDFVWLGLKLEGLGVLAGAIVIVVHIVTGA